MHSRVGVLRRHSHRHSVDGRIVFATTLLVALLNAGCFSTYFVPIEPATPVELEPREALLVMQIDSDLPIRELSFSNLDIRTPIEAGEHFWIARVRPGAQSWKSVYIDGNSGYKGRYRIVRSKFHRRGELDFTIEPGAINYAGKLIIRKSSVGYRRAWITLRIRNHAAMALRSLEKSHGDLLDMYPLRSAGTSGDGFIEFYAAERKRFGLARKTIPPATEEP